MTSDMVSNYTQLTITYVPGTAFRNSGYLNRISKVARWTLLFGTISCVISVVMYVCPDFILFYIFYEPSKQQEFIYTYPDVYPGGSMLDPQYYLSSDRIKQLHDPR